MLLVYVVLLTYPTAVAVGHLPIQLATRHKQQQDPASARNVTVMLQHVN